MFVFSLFTFPALHTLYNTYMYTSSLELHFNMYYNYYTITSRPRQPTFGERGDVCCYGDVELDGSPYAFSVNQKGRQLFSGFSSRAPRLKRICARRPIEDALR